MSEINITVEGGTSKRLLTAGKYCDRDIVVTASGGGDSDGGSGIADFLMNKLTEIDDDTTTVIKQYGLAYSTQLIKIRFSKLASVNPNAFRWCSGLVTVDLPKLTGNFGVSCFNSCSKLTALIIGRESTSVASLSSTSAFNGTPIASGTGYIYVPSALVDTYKSATNWVTFADQIRAIEDYPEICGV
jgi:hypothetical protein